MSPIDTGTRSLLPAWLLATLTPYRHLLRPTLAHATRQIRELPARFVESFPADATLADVGAGSRRWGASVTTVDIVPGPTVDVVASAEALPFADASMDGVIFQAVLEHVRDERAAIGELARVLKPGGRLLVEVPFLQGYHAAPGDYRRFTEEGLRAFVERDGFLVERSGVMGGPGSALAWILAEFLAMLFSIRSANGYRLARLLTSWIAWPLKFTDELLERHPMAAVACSGVWVEARKT